MCAVMKKILGIFIIVVTVAFGVIWWYQNGGGTVDAGTIGVNDKMKKEAQEKDKSIDNGNKVDAISNTDYITSNMEGRNVRISGVASKVSEGKGNVFFYFKNEKTGQDIKCVMFKKTNNDNQGRKELIETSAYNGSVITLDGQVDVYKGEVEIKVWKVMQ